MFLNYFTLYDGFHRLGDSHSNLAPAGLSAVVEMRGPLNINNAGVLRTGQRISAFACSHQSTAFQSTMTSSQFTPTSLQKHPS
jgi:hypothetical protein